MLATVAFLAFWVVIGLVLFFIAVRGGPRGARATLRSQTRASLRASYTLFAIFYVAVGIVVPLLLGFGNADSDVARAGGTDVTLTEQERHGRELFGEYCAMCHTLAAARANGPVGPNLDELKPPAELTLNAIERGRQSVRGTMPANVVTGNEAEDVALFVAAVAGR
jgi:mono/diheme cytochrome c family protein